jgi:hypothetical protein
MLSFANEPSIEFSPHICWDTSCVPMFARGQYKEQWFTNVSNETAKRIHRALISDHHTVRVHEQSFDDYLDDLKIRITVDGITDAAAVISYVSKIMPGWDTQKRTIIDSADENADLSQYITRACIGVVYTCTPDSALVHIRYAIRPDEISICLRATRVVITPSTIRVHDNPCSDTLQQAGVHIECPWFTGPLPV